ncbi:MAG: carboxypeptidase-like regulatory domain-containing protein [Acidobacteria bacterium]|nr:carboxypeptidase-like regulatory domain-containing protein [Acidobacteriota bacterium]
MKTLRGKFLLATLAALFACAAHAPAGASAQKKPKKPEPTTGAIVGRVRVEAGYNAGGVSVVMRGGDRQVAETSTNAKGEFAFRDVEPGTYGLTLRKSGLQVGRMEGVEVRAGKTVTLREGLYLPVDEGSIAFIRGSVFTGSGRSFNGAKVELARVESDGSLKKLDSRVSNATGSFAFRLPPERALYRLTAKADGMEPATADVEVEGAAIYRAALSLEPARK